MKRKIKLEITDRQLNAIMNITDTISAMIGVGSEFDDEMTQDIRHIDQMLHKNGLKRKYK